jgi:DNA-binding MarR family transcriptional regulator
MFGVWCLVFGVWCLVFGVWCLVFLCKSKSEKEVDVVAAAENAALTPWICFISRLSTRFVGGEMSRMGFGPGQFFLLSELYAEEGLSQDELSQRVGVDKSNTSRALVKLEKFDLIERKNDPQNHRVKKVYLRAKAFKVRNEFKKVQRQWNTKLLKGFTKKEKAALIASLVKIANNAEAAFNQNGYPGAKVQGCPANCQKC